MKNTNLDIVRQLWAVNSLKSKIRKLVFYGENNDVFTGTLKKFKRYI